MKKSTLSAPDTRTAAPPRLTNLRVLCAAALLTALSIVLGKYLAFNITENIRLSFENLPILMAGIFFGPVIGGMVGAVADLVGCLMVGYAINPIITVGGTLIGVLSGLVSLIGTRGGRKLSPLTVYLAAGIAHIVGSMVVKTLGLAVYYGTPAEVLLWRVPVYLVISAAEGTILMILARNRLFMGELNRLLYRRKGSK